MPQSIEQYLKRDDVPSLLARDAVPVGPLYDISPAAYAYNAAKGVGSLPLAVRCELEDIMVQWPPIDSIVWVSRFGYDGKMHQSMVSSSTDWLARARILYATISTATDGRMANTLVARVVATVVAVEWRMYGKNGTRIVATGSGLAIPGKAALLKDEVTLVSQCCLKYNAVRIEGLGNEIAALARAAGEKCQVDASLRDVPAAYLMLKKRHTAELAISPSYMGVIWATILRQLARHDVCDLFTAQCIIYDALPYNEYRTDDRGIVMSAHNTLHNNIWSLHVMHGPTATVKRTIMGGPSQATPGVDVVDGKVAKKVAKLLMKLDHARVVAATTKIIRNGKRKIKPLDGKLAKLKREQRNIRSLADDKASQPRAKKHKKAAK